VYIKTFLSFIIRVVKYNIRLLLNFSHLYSDSYIYYVKKGVIKFGAL